MASGSSSGGSGSRSRGLFSCLYSSCDDEPLSKDLPQELYNLIADLYEVAFCRLPVETMPELARVLVTGGFCLGLLDPVSNIILNTVSLLPDDGAIRGSSPKRSKRLARQTLLPNGDKYDWHQVASRSYYSLIDFIMSYFGCLTMEQAIRYLHWAKADIALAVLLVEHDLYPTKPQILDPRAARTHAALKLAAQKAGHPAPNRLVQLIAVRLNHKDFEFLGQQVTGDWICLSSDDVRAIHRLLRCQITPPCDTHVTHGEGFVVFRVRREQTAETTVCVSTDLYTTTTTTTVCRVGEYITDLRRPRDMYDMLEACCGRADAQKYRLKTPCGDACSYLQSLKMCVQDIIHNFYILALMRLPCTGAASGSLMHSFLVAGHCYGCMDPVSNIIINSIWYNKRCPLSEANRTKIEPYSDILNALSLLRTQVHSLNGLIRLVCATVFPDNRLSTASALEILSLATCDIVHRISLPILDYNPFQEAAIAAGHPLPADLGLLHKQLMLMPQLQEDLHSLMSQTSNALSIDHIASILDNLFSTSLSPPLLAQAPKLCPKALKVVSRERSEYEARRSFFRLKIEQLLEKYASQHFWEPKYTLNFICGVVERGGGSSSWDKSYHVNFMATPEVQLGKTLFFAEFWESNPDETKPNFCCPLPYPFTGRCYYGLHSARKIVYPNSAEYITCDISEHGTDNVDGMLETDFVYFSFERDCKFAKTLESYYAPNCPVFWKPDILCDGESSGGQIFSSKSASDALLSAFQSFSGQPQLV